MGVCGLMTVNLRVRNMKKFDNPPPHTVTYAHTHTHTLTGKHLPIRSFVCSLPTSGDSALQILFERTLHCGLPRALTLPTQSDVCHCSFSIWPSAALSPYLFRREKLPACKQKYKSICQTSIQAVCSDHWQSYHCNRCPLVNMCLVIAGCCCINGTYYCWHVKTSRLRFQSYSCFHLMFLYGCMTLRLISLCHSQPLRGFGLHLENPWFSTSGYKIKASPHDL